MATKRRAAETLLLDGAAEWHRVAMPPLLSGPTDEAAAGQVRGAIGTLYEAQVALHNARQRSSEREWRVTATKTGTATDRIAALSLLVQEAPFYSLDHLAALARSCQRPNRREALAAVDALIEALNSRVLPGRRLEPLHRRDMREATDLQKVAAYFEDSVKRIVFDLLRALEAISRDAVVSVREKAVKALFALAVGGCEQENNVFSLLANKLGDTDRRTASRVSYHLSQIVETRPSATLGVINQVRQSMLRRDASMRGQYYAAIFLNQIQLRSRRPEVSGRLMALYHELFARKVKEDVEDADVAKVLDALLTGINRALPFVQGSVVQQLCETYLDSLFRLVHVGPFSTSVHALLLLQKLCCSLGKEASERRYFRALYEMMLDGRLAETSSKHALFLTLVYRSVLPEEGLARAAAVLRRLVQAAVSISAAFLAASLLLVSEVCRLKTGLRVLFVGLEEQASRGSYDLRKRDPEYAGAMSTAFVEVHELQRHYHPTIAKYAQALVKGDAITCMANPLETFAPTAFLDRFVHKQPKRNRLEAENKRPSLAFVQTAGNDATPLHVKYAPGSVATAVPEDEAFFAEFFRTHGRAPGEEDDDAGLSDESFPFPDSGGEMGADTEDEGVFGGEEAGVTDSEAQSEKGEEPAAEADEAEPEPEPETKKTRREGQWQRRAREMGIEPVDFVPAEGLERVLERGSTGHQEPQRRTKNK